MSSHQAPVSTFLQCCEQPLHDSDVPLHDSDVPLHNSDVPVHDDE